MANEEVRIKVVADFDGSKLSSGIRNALNGIKAPKNIFDVSNNVKQIQSALRSLKLPSNIQGNFSAQFNDLEKEIEKYQTLLNKPVKAKADVSAIEKSGNKIHQIFNGIIKDISSIDSKKIDIDVNTGEIEKLQNELQSLQGKMGEIGNKSLSKAFTTDFMESISKSGKAKGLKTAIEEAVNVGDFDKAKAKVKELERVLKTLTAYKGNQSGIDNFIRSLTSGLNQTQAESKETVAEINRIGQAIEKLKSEGHVQLANDLRGIAEQANITSDAYDKMAVSAERSAEISFGKVQQVDQLKQQVQYFFGLQNAVYLFRRAVRDTIDTVKELDASMIETAVVTDFNVGDMWAQLPEYTAAANELGSTINDVYKANTLYFQQGLNADQAMGLGIETLKMARIAGMDAAQATDLMTAALRGFNMELNQTSAQRVNDVYSKLAAITASDTQEIGVAVSKTASLASSAGMDLETTSALLAQIVETTREAPETAGTALKTIIARFGEVKELYSEGQLTGTDAEGEEVNINRVDEALQSAGINLKSFAAGQKGLGEIFIELSKRWDSLSVAQQRYIATQAAGARQQSRFIAMMQDTERTQQLVEAAYNANGASAIQFEKTQEGVEAKINKLKNAWDQFAMGIMNQTILKGGLDAIRNGLTGINKIISGISNTVGNFNKGLGGITKTVLSLGTAFAAFGIGGKVVNMGLGGLGGLIDPSKTVKGGFKEGLFGGKNSQVNTIKSSAAEIVSAIHEEGSRIANKEQPPQKISGDYTEAQNQFTNFKKSGRFNANDVINQLDGLDAQQQKMLMKNNTNIAVGMESHFKEITGMASKEGNSTAQEYLKSLKDGLESGKITYADYYKGLTDPTMIQQAGVSFADKYSEIISGKTAEGIKQKTKKQIPEAFEDGGWEAIKQLNKKEEEELDNFAENQKKLQGNIKLPTNKLTKIGGFFDATGQKATAAGMAVSNFGTALRMAGLDTAGALVERLGTGFASLGATVSSVSTLANKLGAAYEKAGNSFSGILKDVPTPMLTAAGAAAGAALIGGIALGIKHRQSELRETAEKLTEDFQEKMKTAQDNQTSLDAIKIDFDELAAGVDEYGNNVSLNDTQYQKYLESVDKITKMSPQLIEGYNAEGKAIINKTTAIQEATKAQEESIQKAREEYTSQESMNALLKGIRQEKNYKKNVAFGSDEGPSTAGLGADTRKMIDSQQRILTKQSEKFTKALKEAGVDIDNEATKTISQMAGHEINLLKPSNKDLQFIGEHKTDVINALEQANDDLTDKQKESIEKSVEGIAKGWTDLSNEIQPLTEQIQQYLSLEQLDIASGNIGKEFTAAFNQGIQDISLEALVNHWDAGQLQKEAKNFASDLSALTGEGSEYAEIMDEITKKQEEYLDSMDELDAVSNYSESVSGYTDRLRELADQQDETTASGRALAESLRYQADMADKYAKEQTITLGQALNTFADEFENAKGIYDDFAASIENGDYYTAREGMKKIYEEVQDGVDNAGKGSLGWWNAADELLGVDYTDNHSFDQIQKQLKHIAPAFEEGEKGANAFFDLIREKGKQLEKEGFIKNLTDDGSFNFDLKPGEDLTRMAEILGMSEKTLSGLLDNARQFANITLANTKEVRKAIMDDENSITGFGSTNGKRNLYYSKDRFREEARAQGYRGDSLKNLIKQQEKNGVILLEASQFLKDTGKGKDRTTGAQFTKQTLSDWGISKAQGTNDLSSAVKMMMKSGVLDNEEIVQALSQKGVGLDKDYTKDEIREELKTQSENNESPVVAGISDTTKGIFDNTTEMLASMGILTDDAVKEAKDNLSKERTDKVAEGITSKDYNTSKEAESRIKEEQGRLREQLAVLEAAKRGGATEYYDEETGKNTNIDNLIKDTENKIKEYDNLITQGNEAQAKAVEKYKSLIELGSNTADQESIKSNAAEIKQQLNPNLLDEKGNISAEKASISTEGLNETINQLNLCDETADALRQKFVDINGTDLSNLSNQQLTSVLQSLGYTKEEAVDVADTLKRTATDAANKAKEAIGNIKLSDEQKQMVIDISVKGKEKVTEYMNSLYKEFEKGNSQSEIMRSRGAIKTASKYIVDGEENKGKQVLEEAGYNEKEIKKITQKIKILPKVTNKEEVKKGIEDSLKTTGGAPQVKVKIKGVSSKNLKNITKSAKDFGKLSDKTVKLKAVTPSKKELTNIKNFVKKYKEAQDLDSTVTKTLTTNGITKTVASNMSNIASNWQAILNKDSTKTFTVTYKQEGKKPKGVDDHIGRNWKITSYSIPTFGSAAKGRTRHKKETSLTGEEGYEVAWFPSEGRSTILGLKGPEMVNLPADAVIYPHKQSKKILKGNKNKPTLGSHRGGTNNYEGRISGNQSNNRNTTKINSKNVTVHAQKSSDSKKGKNSKTGSTKEKKKNVFSVGKVSVWWENISRKVEETLRRIEKASNKFTKQLEKFGTTLKDMKGVTSSYISNLRKSIKYNQEIVNHYNRALKKLDKNPKKKGKTVRTKDATISWSYTQVTTKKSKKGKKTTSKTSKTKKERVDLSDFIYFDQESGTYQVNQKKINKIAKGKKGKGTKKNNKARAKAIAEAANKKINEMTSRRNSAEDNVEKAREQIQQAYKDLSDAFYAWKNELTKIYNITQKIETAEKNRATFVKGQELIEARLSSGAEAFGAFGGTLESSLEKYRNIFKNNLDSLKKTIELGDQQITATRNDLYTKISNKDEQVELNRLKKVQTAINNRASKQTAYNKAQESYDKAIATRNKKEKARAKKEAKLNFYTEIKKAYQNNKKAGKNGVKIASVNGVKVTKENVKKALKAYNNAKKAYQKFASDSKIQAAINSTQKQMNTAAKALDKAKATYKAAAKGMDTVDSGVINASIETAKERLEAQKKALSYAKITANNNGGFDLDIDWAKLETDKDNYKITETTYNTIKPLLEDIVKANQDYEEAIQNQTERLIEIEQLIIDRQKELADISEELLSGLEGQEKEQIDELEKLNNNLDKALQELLDKVKKALDQRRKQDENQKTEQDIADKQQRLAYLRADSAGGNQKEIAQLEKEIADAQKQYGQSLEDQQLEKLQQQADEAKTQREKQIELLQAQLDYSTSNNSLLAQINQWMADPGRYESQIISALKYSMKYDEMTDASKVVANGEIQNKLLKLLEDPKEIEEIKSQRDALYKSRDYLNEIKDLLTQAVGDQGFSKTKATETMRNADLSIKDRAAAVDAYIAAGGTKAEAAQALRGTAGATEVAKEAGIEKEFKEASKPATTGKLAQPVSTNAITTSLTGAVTKGVAKTAKVITSNLTNKTKEKETAYQNAIVKAAKNKKIGKEEFAKIQKVANAAGHGARTYMQALANTKGLSWEQVIRAAKDNGFSKYSMALTFSSDAFKAGFNAVYGKGQYKKVRNEAIKKKKGAVYAYATGGLADYTGPAWLDGTKSKPELVLNAQDTKNFIALKDTLADFRNREFNTPNAGDMNFDIDINVEKLENDYDVKKVARAVKQEIVKSAQYRNVNIIRNLK